MAAAPLRRAVVALVAVLLTTAGLPGLAPAQTATECNDVGTGPEAGGPTDITATTGNRRLSAAVNDEGSVTVLRWPSPSYYDQIKYRTTDRSSPHMGSLPNEGAFIGLAWRGPGSAEWDFAWMRNVFQDDSWNVRQRYPDTDSDEILTRYTNDSVGLRVAMRDVVAPDRNALIRRITVARTATSDVRRARLFSFANFNPVFSKSRQSPTQDWCAEERNDSGAAYSEAADAVVAERSGIDESTGEASSVALAMGFAGRSSQHQVGQDTYEAPGAGMSAYDDAQDGSLSGAPLATGQADGALALDLDLASARSARAAAIITAAPTEDRALRSLDAVRRLGPSAVARSKASWWKSWLRGALLPKEAPRPVRELATRALISIRQAADPRGLIVSSISTQPTMSLDWVRDGAYINRALHSAGHPEMVEKHNLRYAELQATTASKPPGGEATPPGNWSQNFYADGVVGGPVPYEVDVTGLGLWTLWDHYVRTGDETYLLRVYEAIQRGAQYLSDVCRDPATGLQCAAPEGNDPNPAQSLRGAQAVWLGLDSAARAAEVKATLQPSARSTARANARKWRDRRNEIADAILDSFYDPDCKCFTRDPSVGGAFLWPARAIDYAGDAAENQADQNWRGIRPSLELSADRGGAESQVLLGNAYGWSRRNAGRLRDGLRWVATVPTTNQTGILGSAWLYPRDEPLPPASAVITIQGQPHVPSLAKFYLAALKVYGSERWPSR